MNDKVYPILKPKTDDDFSRPLQLLAKKLMFIDPITQAERVFYSDRVVTFNRKLMVDVSGIGLK